MIKTLIPLHFLLLATSVAAQEATQVLDTVVVTASRTPISLSNSGSAVSIVTRSEIERRGTVYVADILRNVPGIAVSRSGTFGSQTQVRLRGTEANHVLVMIDGVEANDPAIGGEFQFEHLTTTEIERIEVVRGPQSALWGSDAVGGVINIITRRATRPFETDGYVESGSFNTTHAGGRISVLRDTYGIDFGVGYLDTDGSNISRVGDEDDGYRNGTLNLTANLTPTEQSRIEFFMRHSDSSQQFDAVDFAQTGLPIDADRASDRSQSYFRTTASVSPTERIEHSIKVTYLDTQNENFSDSVETNSFAAEKLGVYYQASTELGSAEVHNLTFALDHEQEEFTQRGNASPFGDPNQEQNLDTTGYVLEYRVLPTDTLSLSTSLRYDDSSDFDSVTTYRLAASYTLPAGNTRLRTSYGTGQKSPTFIERFGFFPNVFLGNPNLKPERSRGWEFGIEQSLHGDHLTVAATYFKDRLTDEINGFVFDPNLLQFTAGNESGRSHRQGVELTFSARPADAIDLTASYTYLDSTQPDASSGQVKELRRPKHTAAFNFNYAISERANINLDVAYTDTRYDTFFPPFPQIAERRKLASYRLVGLAGSYRLTERLEFFARVENLLDEDYEDVLGFATPGRGAYVGVRVQR